MMGLEDEKMAEEVKKAEDGVSLEMAAPPPAPVDSVKDVAVETSFIPLFSPSEFDRLESKSYCEGIIYRVPSAGGSVSTSSNRAPLDSLARLDNKKKASLIKAWKENEKAKVENKAVKKMSTISAWENSKKAAIEADLKKMEEAFENKMAEYAEKQKNKIAIIHKEAEEKRAIVEAKSGKDLLKAEEMAAKYRATVFWPKKLLGCF